MKPISGADLAIRLRTELDGKKSSIDSLGLNNEKGSCPRGMISPTVDLIAEKFAILSPTPIISLYSI